MKNLSRQKSDKRQGYYIGIFFLLFGVPTICIMVVAVLSQSGIYNLMSKAGGYDPKITPSDFSTKITNKYFSLPAGIRLTYKGETEDGMERNLVYVTGKTKKIMGVDTLIYYDKVWVDGEVVEDTSRRGCSSRPGRLNLSMRSFSFQCTRASTSISAPCLGSL